MPEALTTPTVTVRVYNPSVRDGIRQRDLSVYKSAQFTRQRNTVGTFEIAIPLVPVNLTLLEEIREGWMFEFWSEADTPQFLFGGFVNYMRWSLDEGQTLLTLRGVSYLGWLVQRRIIGGTGTLAWAATLGGLETGGSKPGVNQIMYHAMTYGGGENPPLGLAPPGTTREHPMFRIPNHDSISQVSAAWSTPTLPSEYAIPRPSNTEVTAFMSGIEVMSYLTEQVGDRKNEDSSSVWFGMPRISYDIVRYVGDPFGGWPTNALYFVVKIPGLGSNRTVGNANNKPIIFDVEGGGVASGEYVEDSTEIRNLLFALGAGEKATRARYEYNDGDSIIRYGRVEDVVDAGQEGNLNVLAQKANDVLKEKKDAKITASFRLDAIPGQVFGYDFFFDDAVTVYWSEIGLRLDDFVTSVSLSLGGQDDGTLGIQRVEVVVGNEKLAREAGLLGRYLSGLKRGITHLRV